MKLTSTRLVGVAVALSTIAIAAPVSTAAADTATPPVSHGSVIGPAFITSAPASFVNTNVQVSSGDSSLGPQVAP